MICENLFAFLKTGRLRFDGLEGFIFLETLGSLCGGAGRELGGTLGELGWGVD